MAAQSLGMPAKKNIINLDFFRTEKPVNTISRPYTFNTVDECGNKLPHDLTSLAIEFVILFNNCVQFTGTTTNGALKIGTGLDSNKLWLTIAILTVKPGVYDYEINAVDEGLEMVRGKITIKT